METLALEPSKRILKLQSSTAELQEHDAPAVLAKDKIGASPVKDSVQSETSGLAGFSPLKNPLSYLIGSKDSKSGAADESTTTVIQRPEQGHSDLESDAALEYEDASIDGTHASHAPTVMYDADEFLDAATSVEGHDTEVPWYDPIEKAPIQSSQEKRAMPGSVPSDFGHTGQSALMPSAPKLDQSSDRAEPAIQETVSDLSEETTQSVLSAPTPPEKPALLPQPAPGPSDTMASTKLRRAQSSSMPVLASSTPRSMRPCKVWTSSLPAQRR